MVNIISQLSSDFKQGGCLFKLTSPILRAPKHLWMSDRPQKSALVKANQLDFGSGALMVDYFIDEADKELVYSTNLDTIL